MAEYSEEFEEEDATYGDDDFDDIDDEVPSAQASAIEYRNSPLPASPPAVSGTCTHTCCCCPTACCWQYIDSVYAYSCRGSVIFLWQPLITLDRFHQRRHGGAASSSRWCCRARSGDGQSSGKTASAAARIAHVIRGAVTCSADAGCGKCLRAE